MQHCASYDSERGVVRMQEAWSCYSVLQDYRIVQSNNPQYDTSQNKVSFHCSSHI